MTKQAGGANVGLSDTGSLVYVPAPGTEGRQLVWVDREGREEPLPFPTRLYRGPSLSPDGRSIAVGFDGSLWKLDIRSGASLSLARLARGSDVISTTVWTPDSSRVIFGLDGSEAFNIYSVQADGSGETESLLGSDDLNFPTSVSRDGQRVTFNRTFGRREEAHREIWEVAIDGTEPRPLLGGPFLRAGAVYAPDAPWVAFESDHSGRLEVYVQPYPGPGPVTPVSIGGGLRPTWARDGSALFYRQLTGQMMAVSFEPGDPMPVIGSPTGVFEGRYFSFGPAGWPAGTRQYDVSRDGRFLMMRQFGETPSQINVVLNWTQELLERVSVP